MAAILLLPKDLLHFCSPPHARIELWASNTQGRVLWGDMLAPSYKPFQSFFQASTLSSSFFDLQFLILFPSVRNPRESQPLMWRAGEWVGLGDPSLSNTRKHLPSRTIRAPIPEPAASLLIPLRLHQGQQPSVTTGTKGRRGGGLFWCLPLQEAPGSADSPPGCPQRPTDSADYSLSPALQDPIACPTIFSALLRGRCVSRSEG